MHKYFYILFTILASSYGFTLIKVQKCFVPNASSFSTSSSLFRKDTTNPNSRLLFTSYFASNNKDDGDDDGWESSKEVMSSSNSYDMKRELEALKLERDFKKANSDERVYSSQSSANNHSSTETERDLFIPIFAIVSLAGLFGAYGYEMLRLNAQGELYLPWRQ